MNSAFPVKPLQRRHIEAIVAIGDLRSVHRAAQHLGMQQPVLSRILGEAERLLGRQLFHRSSQGSHPTVYGDAVLAHARFALRSLERLDDVLKAAKPTIRLGCIPRAMHTLVPRLLERMHPAPSNEAAPKDADFRLNVTEGSSALLLEQMQQGSLDLAILRSDETALRVGSNIAFENLYDDRIVIICAAANPALSQSPVALRRLAGEGWVLPERVTTSRLAFDRFWATQDLPPIQPLIEVRSFETNLALVASTRFFSIAPKSIACSYQGLGVRTLNVRPAPPSSPVMLAFSLASGDHPLLADFRTVIREAAAGAMA